MEPLLPFDSLIIPYAIVLWLALFANYLDLVTDNRVPHRVVL
jgi:hypothetical protein